MADMASATHSVGRLHVPRKRTCGNLKHTTGKSFHGRWQLRTNGQLVASCKWRYLGAELPVQSLDEK
jgi:hypothetical protein